MYLRNKLRVGERHAVNLGNLGSRSKILLIGRVLIHGSIRYIKYQILDFDLNQKCTQVYIFFRSSVTKAHSHIVTLPYITDLAHKPMP